MKLRTYLADNKITFTDFAKRIGVGHARTVERYAKGQRHPRPTAMAAIRRETGGAVTADDFTLQAAE